jgi:lipoprotein-anchoring transpeptidase ErfK/SrfK
LAELERTLLAVPSLLLAVVVLTVAGMPAAATVPATVGEDIGLHGGALDPGVPEDPTVGVQGTGPEVPPDAAAGYYVHVSISEQLVRVFLDGVEVRRMVCSTGVPETDWATPTGRFYIQNRGEYFFSERYEQGARWWVSFRDWGLYLFHSVPLDRTGKVIQEEADKLGQPASHGCVRLGMEDARWFYETIPEGTPVDIE